MERAEIKRTLAGWRPGSNPAQDPEILHALDAAALDPELRDWLKRHATFQEGTADALRNLPVPDDLVSQILARRRIVRPAFRRSYTVWIAAAAGIVAALVWAWSVLPVDPGPDYSTFRRRMVRAAIREYRMDITTTDVTAIRAFLARNNAPADFEFPDALAQLRTVGAGALSWQGGRTSMVCLDGGADGMLYLFIVPRSTLAGGAPEAPEYTQVNRLSTSTWSRDGKTYVLASSASLDALRKYQ